MPDFLTKSERSKRMSRIRGKNTGPERMVRTLVHSMGYRYRLHEAGLPGKPDLVFASRRKVIFVHGCFWHLHQNCRHYRMPKARKKFWLAKLEGNRARDRRNREELKRLGWSYLILWECQLKGLEKAKIKLSSFLEGPSK